MHAHIHIGYPISWMRLRGVFRSSGRKACFPLLQAGALLTISTVIEMLLAVLAVCSQEELEESESSSSGDEAERVLMNQAVQHGSDSSARRQQIKNKILAVGRVQRMFQLLRYVTVPHGWIYTHVEPVQ
jgi:hypothetical protein